MTDDLSDAELERIMETEDNETKLMKWEYDPIDGGQQPPATGGKWFIRAGNWCMLPEVVSWAHQFMTMYDIYRMWTCLPILADKRVHSESQSENAQRVRNAKTLKFQEEGRYGLNVNVRRGRQRRR